MPLISQQTGQKLIETLSGPNDEVLYTATHELTSDNTLKTINETWDNKALEVNNKMLLQGDQLLGGKADAAVAAAKLAWDIIKEGKAVGKSEDAKSSVLSAKDMDPLSYEGAKNGKSATYTWRINDSCTLFGTINYVTIKLRVEGKYGATPVPGSEAPAGKYLPDVYVNVTECSVKFPWSASGSANLSNPSNIGRGAVNAEVKVHGKLNAGWLAHNMGITIGFEATGTGGFRLIGKE